MMQRRLVLTNEAARHPLRRSLPPVPRAPDRPRRRWFQREDGQLFMLSFAAFFTAFYGFIA